LCEEQPTFFPSARLSSFHISNNRVFNIFANCFGIRQLTQNSQQLMTIKNILDDSLTNPQNAFSNLTLNMAMQEIKIKGINISAK
jgi:hypothetical protein